MEKNYQSSGKKDDHYNIWLDIEQKSAKSPVQAAAPYDIWQLAEGRLTCFWDQYSIYQKKVPMFIPYKITRSTNIF